MPFVLLGSALAFWPGVWLYGAYMYPYSHPYHYHNATTDKDEERNVTCGCAQYAVCGCDQNNDTSYIDDLIGNGSWAALNHSVVTVAEVNGTKTILINGTLPNGTTLQDENASDAGDSDSAASASMHAMIEALGFWPAVAAVVATVYML